MWFFFVLNPFMFRIGKWMSEFNKEMSVDIVKRMIIQEMKLQDSWIKSITNNVFHSSIIFYSRYQDDSPNIVLGVSNTYSKICTNTTGPCCEGKETQPAWICTKLPSSTFDCQNIGSCHSFSSFTGYFFSDKC